METEVHKVKTNERRIQVSANVKDQIWSLAKQHNISWTDALEFGILFKLADSDGGVNFEYPPCNIKNKLEKLIVALNNKCLEVEDLEKRVNGKQTE